MNFAAPESYAVRAVRIAAKKLNVPAHILRTPEQLAAEQEAANANIQGGQSAA